MTEHNSRHVDQEITKFLDFRRRVGYSTVNISDVEGRDELINPERSHHLYEPSASEIVAAAHYYEAQVEGSS